jgi:flagellar basal-body rod protein FlgB
MYNHTNLLHKSLDVLSLRQEVIAHNMANNDTPDYKAQHVAFESLYRQAVEDQKNGAIRMKTSSSRHFEGEYPDPDAVAPVVVSENWHTMRMDGNNVDVDQEMNDLAVNTIRYNLTIQQVTDELRRLRTAITG